MQNYVTKYCHKIKKGEKTTMIKAFKKNYLPASELILTLIKETKYNTITWVNMGYLKSYLRRDDLSLNSIQVLKEFLQYLQAQRFIFDCENTYLSKFNDTLIVVSKSKYSDEYRVDSFDFKSNLGWNRLLCSFGYILRLRNIIEFSYENNEYECSEFLASISLNNRV